MTSTHQLLASQACAAADDAHDPLHNLTYTINPDAQAHFIHDALRHLATALSSTLALAVLHTLEATPDDWRSMCRRTDTDEGSSP